MSVIIDVLGPRAGSFGYSGPAYRQIMASTLEGLTDPEDRHEVERAQWVQLLIIGGDEGSLRIAAAMLDGAKRLTEKVTASPEAKSDAYLAKSLPELTAALEAFLEAPERGPGEPIPPVEDLASEREGWVSPTDRATDAIVFPGWAFRHLLESTIEALANDSDIEGVNLGWWYKELRLAVWSEPAVRIATAMRDAATRIAEELDHDNDAQHKLVADRLLELRQKLDAFPPPPPDAP
jgi:hypothetical protein